MIHILSFCIRINTKYYWAGRKTIIKSLILVIIRLMKIWKRLMFLHFVDIMNNNIVHFIVISGIYLINLLLIFLNDFNYIQWELNFISPFALLGIAAILGFILYFICDDTLEPFFFCSGFGLKVTWVLLLLFLFFLHQIKHLLSLFYYSNLKKYKLHKLYHK